MSRRVELRWRGWAAGLAALLLAACGHTQLPPLAPITPELATSSMAALPGWAAEDHAAAFAVVRRACATSAELRETRACAEAEARPRLADAEARAFLERRFRAEPIAGEGLLTGYFAPT